MSTVVVGGGLAGALAARALDLAGEDVTVVDAGAEPGGVARSLSVEGFLLEPAAGSLMLPDPLLDRLIEGLAVELSPSPGRARRRFVYHRGRTVEVRPGPGLLTTPLLSAGGKLRVLGEPLVPRGPGDETVEAFLTRRLGREAGSLAAGLMAAGVHAGDPKSLAVEAAFPGLARLEREHGSLGRGLLSRSGKGARPSTHVVVGGTARLAEAVAESLGDCWRRSWTASRLEPIRGGWRVHGPEVIEAGRVVAAVDPETLGHLYPPLAGGASAGPWAPVAVVWLGLLAPALPGGFGVLIGPEEGCVTRGFLYESVYAPERAPRGRHLVKAIVGGATDPVAVSWPDDTLVERVTAEFSRVLGPPTVEMTRVVRHHPGIPQYTGSRMHMVQRLRSSLPPALDVCGWAYDGVGVTALARAAQRLARR